MSDYPPFAIPGLQTPYPPRFRGATTGFVGYTDDAAPSLDTLPNDKDWGFFYDIENAPDVITLAFRNGETIYTRELREGGDLRADMPTYADNAAAVEDDAAVNTVYKTATGEVRIVV